MKIKNYMIAPEAMRINSAIAEDGRIELCVALAGSWKSKKMTVTQAHLAQMLANFQSEGLPLLFDLDHNSLYGCSSAVGWGRDMELKEDGKLYVMMTPTAKGKQMIEDEEYRYLSPVYETMRIDRVTGKKLNDWRLHSVALTNTPYLRELPPIKNTSPNGGNHMDELMKMLGVSTEDEVVAQVTKLVNAAATQEAEIGIMRTKINAQEVDAAIANKKLLPGQRELAIKLINSDRSYFEELCATFAPVIAPLSTEIAIEQKPAENQSDLDKVSSFSELMANSALDARMQKENPNKWNELYEIHMKKEA